MKRTVIQLRIPQDQKDRWEEAAFHLGLIHAGKGDLSKLIKLSVEEKLRA